MGIFNKLFGFRWSLYVVRNENELVYAMHEHSVMRMIGYVMNYFANGGKPVEPWSLYLNFNKKHQKIKLDPEHFAPDGSSVSSALIHKIESIDPGWKVKSSEPVFEEVATKKRLKINERESGRLENMDKPREVTFFSVMRQVFEKRTHL